MPNADLAVILQVLQVISLLGAAALASKLFATGLWKHYPIFFLYLVFRIPNTAWPLLLNTSSNLYQKVWMLTEPIAWIFHVLIVIELYRLVLSKHRGIYTLGRWVMYGALAVAITISILSLLPHIKPHMPQQTKYMGYEFAINRGTHFALAVFLLVMLFLGSRFPMALSRNVLVHAAIYTAFFLADSLAMFLRTLFGLAGSNAISACVVALQCACLAAWLILLNAHGEEVRTNFPAISPQRERNALRQLESLNATLLKASGK